MGEILIVGLGNPGSEYAETRHNTGFMVLDELAVRWKKRFRTGRGEYSQLATRVMGRDVRLIKPLTFMNNAGLAVRDVLTRTDNSTENLLVVLDDVAIPLGQLRMRPAGSDGGHNGLGSIIGQLETGGFARLRCGIGQREVRQEELSSFVLAPFDHDEMESVAGMIRRAADAVETFIESGINRAMSLYNASQETGSQFT